MVVSTPNEVDTQNLVIDERATLSLQEIKRIRDSIHNSVVLGTDCPENHENSKIPILDLLSMDGNKK